MQGQLAQDRGARGGVERRLAQPDDLHRAVAARGRVVAVERALTHVGELAAELDGIASLAARLLRTEAGVVSLVGRHEQTYVGRSSGHLPRRLDVPSTQTQCAHVVTTGAPLVVGDVLDHAAFAGHPAATAGLLRFYAAVPVRDEDGEVVGTVCAIDPAPRAGATPDDIAALEDLAREVSTLLLLGRRSAEQGLQQRVLAAVAADRPLDDTLELLCHEVEGLLGGGLVCSVLVDDDEHDVLRRAAGGSLPASFTAAVPVLPRTGGFSVPSRAAASRDATVVEDCRAHPDPVLGPLLVRHGLGGVASLPVLDPRGGRVLGVLALYRREPGRPTAYEWTTLRRVRDLAGVAIDRAAAREALTLLATRDRGTGLLRRAAFLEAAGQALTRPPAPAHEHVLLLCDLDRFALVNDALGTEVGDRLLQQAGASLAAALRPADLVGRFAGDAFSVLALDVAAPAVAALAQRAAEALQVAVGPESGGLRVTASIGAASTAVSGSALGDLLRDADLAVHAAKEAGRARAVVCAGELRRRAQERIELTVALRAALDSDELSVVYQPEVELATGRVVGLEALSRWTRPGTGAVSPAVFIPVAEQAGLVGVLGLRVLRRALDDAAALWQADPAADVVVWVNVSARQLDDDGLVDVVDAELAARGLPGACLGIEVTESAVMADPATARRVLQRLRDRGVRIAVDDFGTGYSSLALLQQLPVDALKVDRSFVQGLGDDGPHLPVVIAVLAMADALGLEVIAEGVETEQQREVLRSLGCATAQGFLLGRPQPVEQVAGLLGRTAPAA